MRRRRTGRECRDRHIRSASVTVRRTSAIASAVEVESIYFKVLDGHGLAASEAGDRLMHTMRGVFSADFLVAFVVWTVNQSAVAVDVDVVD